MRDVLLKLECNVPRPAADWQCRHEAGAVSEGAGSSDRRSPGRRLSVERRRMRSRKVFWMLWG